MPCPICNSETTHYQNIGDTSEVICLRCGNFRITGTASGILRDSLTNQQIANISSWIRYSNEPTLNSSNIEQLKNLPTPTVGEKARRLMLNIAKNHPIPGQSIRIDQNDLSIYSMIGCFDNEEFMFIFLTYLIKTKKFLGNIGSGLSITPEGWAYIESLKDINPDSQIGFIAMWFDSSMDEASAIIHEAIRKAGYEPLRIDNKEHNKNINDEIIATIRQSKFVVADFTGQRDGVYYESGYANGLGLEVIWLCEESDFDNVHFDANHNNFIIWNRTDYPALEKKLTDRIIATLGKGPLE